jgi:hypothetical protein
MGLHRQAQLIPTRLLRVDHRTAAVGLVEDVEAAETSTQIFDLAGEVITTMTVTGIMTRETHAIACIGLGAVRGTLCVERRLSGMIESLIDETATIAGLSDGTRSRDVTTRIKGLQASSLALGAWIPIELAWPTNPATYPVPQPDPPPLTLHTIRCPMTARDLPEIHTPGVPLRRQSH